MAIPNISFPNFTGASLAADAGALLGILTASLAVDVVAVYNQATFAQVFPAARPMSGSLRKMARVMDYPVENGSLVSDHEVILPMAVEFPLIIPSGFYESTYNEIKQLFSSAELLIVQTRVDVMRNFIIEDMSHDEKPDMYDNIAMRMRLKEVLLVVSPTLYAPEEPVQSNTIARGQVIPTNPATVPAINTSSFANSGIAITVADTLKPKNMQSIPVPVVP